MTGNTSAAASRMHTPRPASTSILRPPARTSVAAPARSRSGNGFPVPNSTTSIVICSPRLRRNLVHDSEVDKLRSAVEDLRHRCPRGLQSLLASRIALARSSLLLALEDGQHVDAAGIVLVPHGRRAHEARTRLFDRPQLLDQRRQVLLPARLQTRRDELCPHARILRSPTDAGP